MDINPPPRPRRPRNLLSGEETPGQSLFQRGGNYIVPESEIQNLLRSPTQDVREEFEALRRERDKLLREQRRLRSGIVSVYKIRRETVFRRRRAFRKARKPKALVRYPRKPTRMSTQQQEQPPPPPAERSSWRELDEAQARQLTSDKGKHVKITEGFEGLRTEDWLGWFEDLENAFLLKGITSDEAKIYLALQSMAYGLRKMAGDLRTAVGRSWPNFKQELQKEWAIEAKFGSESALQRVIKKHRGMGIDVSESDFNAYQREFKYESRKLQTEPALLSNHTLVGLYLSAFTDGMKDKIIAGLQVKLAAKLSQEDAAMRERRKQDPWLLEEVMDQAQIMVRSGLGSSYAYSASERAGASTNGKGRVRFMESARAEPPGLITAPKEVEQAVKSVVAAPPKQESNADDELLMGMSMDVQNHGKQLHEIKKGFSHYNEKLDRTEKRWDKEFAALKQLIMSSQVPVNSGRSNAYGVSNSGMSGHMQNQSHGAHMQSSGFGGSQGASGGAPQCFMCNGVGHISTECDYQKKFLKNGWIRFDPDRGRLVLKDGTSIPMQPRGDPEPRFQKIEKIAKNRGWIQTGAEEAPSDPSAYMYWTEEPVVPAFYNAGEAEDSIDEEDLLDDEECAELTKIFKAFTMAKKTKSKESKN